MRNVFVKSLLDLARNDKDIVLITGDLGYGVLDEFAHELPNQFLNLGVTEQSSVSIAAGMASEGFKPFYYSIANFPTFRCLEQIRNDIVYMEKPVTIVAVGAGLTYSSHGYTHHATEDISIMRTLLPDSVYSPYSEKSVNDSLTQIVNQGKPAYLRLGLLETEICDVKFVESSKIILIYTGSLNSRAKHLSETLKLKLGEISIWPIHRIAEQEIADKLPQIKSAKLIISLEEHSRIGGLGSFLLETFSKMNLQIKLMSFGLDPKPIHFSGTREYLLDKAGLNVSTIEGQVIQAFSNIVP